MSFWGGIKRVLSLDLHSYWEVFYLDLAAFIFSVLLAFPSRWLAIWMGVNAQLTEFMIEHIEKPVENNAIKLLAPSGLSQTTYETITLLVIFLIEMAVIHLGFCSIYHLRKQRRTLEINAAPDVDPGQYYCRLPHVVRVSTHGKEEEEKKVSFWRRLMSELKRICSLDLHHCGEVLYLDLMMNASAALVLFTTDLICLFLNRKHPVIRVGYIAIPLEENVIRPLAPSGLDDNVYVHLTLFTLAFCGQLVFHLSMCMLYICKRNAWPKPAQTADDVENGYGCFPRTRVAPVEEKRPLVKAYQSVFSISSSSLYNNGSTEKLMKDYALP